MTSQRIASRKTPITSDSSPRKSPSSLSSSEQYIDKALDEAALNDLKQEILYLT